MSVQVHKGSSFGEIISWHGAQTDPHKPHLLTDMQPPPNKKELKSFLWTI